MGLAGFVKRSSSRVASDLDVHLPRPESIEDCDLIEERSNMKPVCLVIGAGAGIGGNVARRFAQEGYHACLCRRSDLDGLNKMVDTIKADGGSATGFLLNAIEANAIEERVAAIEADIGPIEIVVYNLGAQIGDRALKDTSLKAFETGWRLGTFGLFRLAAAVCPLMEARGVCRQNLLDKFVKESRESLTHRG